MTTHENDREIVQVVRQTIWGGKFTEWPTTEQCVQADSFLGLLSERGYVVTKREHAESVGSLLNQISVYRNALGNILDLDMDIRVSRLAEDALGAFDDE